MAGCDVLVLKDGMTVKQLQEELGRFLDRSEIIIGNPTKDFKIPIDVFPLRSYKEK